MALQSQITQEPIRTLTLRRVFLILLCMAVSGPATAQWQVVAPVDYSVFVHWADYHLAIDDSSGAIYMAHMPQSNWLTVRKFNGIGWDTVGRLNPTLSYISEPSIAINPYSHEPYVAYIGQGGTMVQRYDGVNWVTVGPGPISNYAESPLICFDRVTHELYVAINKTAPAVYRISGNTWQQLGGSIGLSATQHVGRSYDFAINPGTNEPYFAFLDAASNHRPVVKRFNGTSWVRVGSISTDTAAYFPRIAFDSLSGQVYLAYVMGGVHCQMLNNGSWVDVGSQGFAKQTLSGEGIILRVSPVTHRPYIGYSDYTPAVIKFDGYNWTPTGNIPPGTGYGTIRMDMQFHPLNHELYALRDSIHFATLARLTPCSVSTFDTVTVCTRYQRPENRGYYTSSGIYSDTVNSAAFCDSIATIQLNVKTVDTSVTRVGNVWTSNQSGAAYQWYSCWGPPIIGATSQSYTLTSAYPVAVMVTYNGCTESSGCPPPPVATNSVAPENELTLFPNPTTGVLIFQSRSLQKFKVTIQDITGRTVLDNEYSGPKFFLELPGPSGLYFVKVAERTRGEQNFKIVKQ